MIEIYAWNTKIFKIGDIVEWKAKLIEIPPLAGQKKNQGQGIIKQFSCCLLRLWAGKINGNKKKISMRENKKWAVPSCDPIIKLYSL